MAHSTAARTNQLQRRDLDRLGVDAHHDEPAAHRKPADRRGHRLDAGDGRQHLPRTAETVEYRGHVLGRTVDEIRGHF